MKHFLAMLAITTVAFAQQDAKASRKGEAHPDLSGVWAYIVGLPPFVVKKEGAGAAKVNVVDRGLSRAEMAKVKGALASTPEPSYKPEHLAKVKDLFDHEGKTDPVFYCGKPGVPRIGTPRKIVQLPNEIIFFYEDISGDPYRIIPINGKHHENGNPSAYGDSVARWEGKTLVVDVTNFLDDTWFGEGGYFHSDAMHVTERLWRDGDNLAYQAIVDDPKVLTKPWVMPAKVVKPSTDALEESPRCMDDDGHRLLNDDHHGQR